MNDQIKAQIEKAKKFAKEHQTLTACAITAVVASKITYNITVEHCVEKVADYVCKSEETTGQLRAACTDAFEFILEKDLMNEFIQTAPRLSV